MTIAEIMCHLLFFSLAVIACSVSGQHIEPTLPLYYALGVCVGKLGTMLLESWRRRHECPRR